MVRIAQFCPFCWYINKSEGLRRLLFFLLLGLCPLSMVWRKTFFFDIGWNYIQNRGTNYMSVLCMSDIYNLK